MSEHQPQISRRNYVRAAWPPIAGADMGPVRFEVENDGATWALPVADFTVPHEEWELAGCPDRIVVTVESA